jgi:CheY-like chemotaxis protein
MVRNHSLVLRAKVIVGKQLGESFAGVDDDAAVRTALRLLMRSWGMRAQAFGSAEEFLDALPAEAPDCLVLGLNMPGMDGSRAAGNPGCTPQRDFRNRHYRPFRFVARGACPGAGARIVFEKPVREPELITAIELALQK